MGQKQASLKDWLFAARLRTLPLAFSSIIAGGACAHAQGYFDAVIFTLALMTTLFLQVLSNLANDYGDAVKGTDNDQRVGPVRAIQSGAITKTAMKKAVVLCAILSLITGLTLVLYATRSLPFYYPLGFVLLGLLAIVAAIKYTAGENPYGYNGWGDLFVFIFFGLVGVIGSYLLYGGPLVVDVLFPAISIGCFSAAVLNLNNMRDWENDKASGKNTLVVKMGFSKAKFYHLALIITGVISTLLFIDFQDLGLNKVLVLLPLLLLLIHLRKVAFVKEPQALDPELKKVALTTFFYTIFLLWM